MKPEIEYKLLKAFYPKGIELKEGMYFDIGFDGDNFVLSMNNPNDTPYTKTCVNVDVADKLNDFYNMIGFELSPNEIYKKYVLKDIGQSYYSKELLDKIKKALQEITELEFIYYETDSIGWEIGDLIVEHVDFKLTERNDKEGLLLFNNVRVLEAFMDGEETSVYTGIQRYKHSQMKDRYDDSERNYEALDHVINQYPLLSDNGWQVFSTHTIFENE